MSPESQLGLVMRRYNVVGFLGIALGTALSAALGTSPPAIADAIDDAWPYDVGTPYGTTLPGAIDIGSYITTGQQNFGPIADTQHTFNYLHDFGGGDWYSVKDNVFVIPSLLSDDHQEVTALLDNSATFPSVGTVSDQFEMFPISYPIGGTVPVFAHDYLYDPQLGYADQFTFQPFLTLAFTNIFLSDTAGIKDAVNLSGYSFTLFEIPFATPDAGATAASDVGDGFQQLLTEFTSVVPGADSLLDMF